jgi:hypothetical protein
MRHKNKRWSIDMANHPSMHRESQRHPEHLSSVPDECTSAPAREVEHLQDALRMLVAERQSLREHDARHEGLEKNRLELGRRQRQLSRALVARYLRHPERSAA